MKPRRTLMWLVLVVAVVGWLTGCFGGGAGDSSYVVSGRVTDKDGKGVEGVTLILSGGTSSSVITDREGKWRATAKGTVTIRPTGYSFQPAEHKVSSPSDKLNFLMISDPNVLEEIVVSIGPAGGVIASDSHTDAPAVIVPSGVLLRDDQVIYRVLDEVPLPTHLAEVTGKPIYVGISADGFKAGSSITIRVEKGRYGDLSGIALKVGEYWLPLEHRTEGDFWLADLPLDLFDTNAFQTLEKKTMWDAFVSIYTSKNPSHADYAISLYEFENGGWSEEPIFRTGDDATGFLRGNGGDVILMVHGILLGCHEGWTDLANYLIGINDNTKIYAVEYGTGYSLSQLGAWLANMIFRGYADQSIKIVAHSQGGVFTRVALELHDAHYLVTKFVTLASPHQGVLLGMLHTFMLNYESIIHTGWKAAAERWIVQAIAGGIGAAVPEIPDLARDSELMRRLNGNITKSNCEYYFAAGTNKEGYFTTPFFDAYYLPIERMSGQKIIYDGVVERESALGESLNMSSKRPSFETIEYPLDHSAITMDQSVIQQVAKWLDIKPRFYDVWGWIADDNGEGIPNVCLTFEQGGVSFDYGWTSASGFWSRPGLSGVVTIIPEYQDCIFIPGSATVSSGGEVRFIAVPPPTEYAVSGRVSDGGGVGIKGVTLDAMDGDRKIGSTLSADDGTWELRDLLGVITVIPSKKSYVFVPATSLRLNGPTTGVDFVGHSTTYTASGRVTRGDTGEGIKGVTIDFNQGFDSTTTDQDGIWIKRGLAGEVSVTPSKDDWDFSPVSRTVKEEAANVNFVGQSRLGELVLQATSGTLHNLGLTFDGTVWAWGYNDFGQVGLAQGQYYAQVPTPLPDLPAAKMVAAGGKFSLALTDDGRVWTWGRNNRYQLGRELAAGEEQSCTPVAMDTIDEVDLLAAGDEHSIALKRDGTVWAWGAGNWGQLGNGAQYDSLAPVQAIGLADVTRIAAGDSYSIALKRDGTVWAWGCNNRGVLGDGASFISSVPIQVVGIRDVVAIAAGGNHCLALKSDGTVWAWGYNGYGQLGDGTYQTSHHPVQVDVLDNVTAIAAGYRHSLAACSDGTAWAWGCNENGQLGCGSTGGNMATPVRVKDLEDVMGFGGGFLHSLALTNDHVLWAWGYNSCGQLGDGTWSDKSSPVRVGF